MKNAERVYMKFRMPLVKSITGAMVVIAVVMILPTDTISAQPIPIPAIYSGKATAAGQPVPDGYEVVARIGSYQSLPRPIKNGSYAALTVSPPDAAKKAKEEAEITFHLNGVPAEETEIFKTAHINLKMNLTFPGLPTPTPTATPTPTETPLPSPTPEIAMPAIYSGVVAILGGVMPQEAVLIAKVGTYKSMPAFIDGDNYSSLVVDPNEIGLVGERIEFSLNGINAMQTDIYKSGAVRREFNLVFTGLPTPTPTPSNTPAPTATLTPTPIPTTPPKPTATTVSPTSIPTLIIPTATPFPTETATPTLTPTIIPTALPTAAPTVTETPQPTMIADIDAAEEVQQTPTPVAATGGCFASPGAPVSSGIGNILLLIAPVACAAGYRRVKMANRAKED